MISFTIHTSLNELELQLLIDVFNTATNNGEIKIGHKKQPDVFNDLTNKLGIKEKLE